MKTKSDKPSEVGEGAGSFRHLAGPPKRPRNFAQLKRHVKSLVRWLAVLSDGLNGHPHSMSEADAMEKCLAKLDIHLLSKTRASKRGLQLRRGAKAVVIRYYGAPVGAMRELFCREQFIAKAGKATAESAIPKRAHAPEQEAGV